jgi:UDP-N-acetylmuramate--alanine ligase
MECYVDLEDLEDCFVQFANRVPFYGSDIICIDDPGVKRIEGRLTRPVVSYGLDERAEFRAREIEFKGEYTSFELHHKGERIARVKSKLLGYHNVRNLLAAIAAAYELDVPLESAIPAAETFTGISRRLELVGERRGIRFYDDYAHHPTEIMATLEGMRSVFKGRIVAVFQPHLYSRTKSFYREFGSSFFDADMFVALDVYPAREKRIDGVSGKLIADTAKKEGHQNVRYLKEKDDLPGFLRDHLVEGDRVIMFGAGDIFKYTRKTLELMGE